MEQVNFLNVILCLIIAALAVTVLFRRLRLSVILGYLVVGAIVGPHGLNLAYNTEYARNLAEFGIVFLMFTIGLEFSLPKLFTLKQPVFILGGLQVILTIAITTFVGIHIIGMTKLSALIVGSIVAMSSTALVVKQLQDQQELHTVHGLNAVGVLLFQDLAVIPLMILIGGLTQGGEEKLAVTLLWALSKGVLAIILIFMVGRWLLRPLFQLIAKTKAVELFTLTVLLVTLSGAWLTNIFGLSYALGAFLAGLMLAETEFRHQIEVEIRPFRDILLSLFFITIGMLTDISHWDETWKWILLLVLALIVGKFLLIAILARITNTKNTEAISTGLVLAQGGEFGFALLTLSLRSNIISDEYSQVILAALLISIALAPIIIRFNQKIAGFLLPLASKKQLINSQRKMNKLTESLNNHVILCGYGRVGQHIARLLNKVKVPYVGLDLDSELVRFAEMAGDKVIYGDPSHPGILHAAGIDSAKVLVISFDDLKTANCILSVVKHSHPNLPVLVRCRDEFELRQLKNLGAKYVIAELFEASLTISHQLLNLLQVPAQEIHELIKEGRNKDYDLLQRTFTSPTSETKQTEEHPLEQPKQLRPFIIGENDYAAGKMLTELALPTDTEIVAIRRGESEYMKPTQDTRVEANDILIIYANAEELEDVQSVLEKGLG